MLSLDSEDEDIEARSDKYAIIALSKHNKKYSSNFELVESGPLGSGCCSKGRVLHLNFKAKNKDEPDAAVQSFFSELIVTNRTVVYPDRVVLIGPADLLPG